MTNRLLEKIPESLRHTKAALALLETVTSILVIIVMATSKGTGSVVPVLALPVRYDLAFAYPFATATGVLKSYDDKNATAQQSILALSGTIGTSAKLVLAVAGITIFLALARLLLYRLVGETPKSQFLAPLELGVTSLVTIMVLVAASIFLWQASVPLKDQILQALNGIKTECSHDQVGGCTILPPNYTGVRSAGALMVISGLLWAVNIWYAYRGTFLHRPYYVSQVNAGDGPGAREIPTLSSSEGAPRSAGTFPGVGSGRSRSWQPGPDMPRPHESEEAVEVVSA